MRIIITAIVAFGLSYILNGVEINSFWTAIILAIVLALLSVVARATSLAPAVVNRSVPPASPRGAEAEPRHVSSNTLSTPPAATVPP